MQEDYECLLIKWTDYEGCDQKSTMKFKDTPQSKQYGEMKIIASCKVEFQTTVKVNFRVKCPTCAVVYKNSESLARFLWKWRGLYFMYISLGWQSPKTCDHPNALATMSWTPTGGKSTLPDSLLLGFSGQDHT